MAANPFLSESMLKLGKQDFQDFKIYGILLPKVVPAFILFILTS